jgi:hypothetical protein
MEYKKICVNGISYGEIKDIFDYSGFPSVTNVDFGDYYLSIGHKPSG